MKHIQLIILTTALTFSINSLAAKGDNCNKEKHKRHAPEKFSEIDTNDNGQISLAEFKQHRLAQKREEKLFNLIDDNKDGIISTEELSAHKPPHQRKKRHAKNDRG